LRQTRKENILARRIAEEAIEMDPDYATSYHVLAFTHMMDAWLKTTKSPKQSIMQAIELSERAIALDGSYSLAHALLGWLYPSVA
jgi:Tfp pilus assembly protein PilF